MSILFNTFGKWPPESFLVFGRFAFSGLLCLGCGATVRLGAHGMPWGVLQTHLNASEVAVQNLKRQDYEYYNPRFNERVIVQGRSVTWRRVQLFKDYLFVKIESRWRSLMSTRGVKQLLMWHENQPALMSDDEIEKLRAREDPLTGLIDVVPRGQFVPGQSVQFKSKCAADGGPHPFAWQHAIYDDQNGEERVFVLLSLLGAKRRMQVDKRDLIAA